MKISTDAKTIQETPVQVLHLSLLNAATDLAYRLTRGTTPESIVLHEERERRKRGAWEALYRGDHEVEHVVTILEMWGHRDISRYGVEGRPTRSRLEKWALEIAADVNEREAVRG